MRRGFTQPHFFVHLPRVFLSSRLTKGNRAGFTLVELLISIAITGILAAMMFSNFAQEKDRNAIKAAVQRLQTDLQAMQTNAQSGIVVGAGVPNGFGLHLVRNASSYRTYADQGTTSTGLYDITNDTVLTVRSLGSSDIIIKSFTGSAAAIVDIIFQSPNGTATIYGAQANNPPTVLDLPNTLTITLKHTKLNLCYAITVTKNVGTVSARQITSSQQCQ